MKIIHLVQSADTSIGGSLTVARALVKAQREQGLDAWLVCLYEHREASEGESASPFEVECSVARSSRWTRGILALRSLILRLRPDIIHHHDGILWPRIATLGLGIPRITHGHLGAPPKAGGAAAQWTHRFMIATTTRLIAISQWVAKSWEDSGMPRDKITIIPNGVDAERFYRRTDSIRTAVRSELGITDKFMLLWVGRMDRETKGLDRLVTLAARLPSDVRLVIAGSGPDREWLSSSLSSLQIATPPLLIGQVDDPADLFGSADAFLFTSRVEPFGLVLLEATCSGLPIYACECEGGGQDLLTELRAVVAVDSNINHLADAIANQTQSISPDRIETVRALYSWPTVAKAITELYSVTFAPTKAPFATT